MGTGPPGPQSPGGEGPPPPDRPHRGPAPPPRARALLAPQCGRRGRRVRASARCSQEPRLLEPQFCPDQRPDGQGPPGGAAHGPGVGTPRADQVPTLRWLRGRQLPPAPARGEAREARPAEGPSPGVLTGRGAAAPPELGPIQGQGRPRRGKQGGGGLHSSQRETHTRPVVRRAVTPEDACPDPQSRGACGSPHPAEGALRM